MLEARGIEKRLGATRALGGVDFDARAGEVVALLGENGAGKSTLLRVLAGDLAPDAGALTLDGKPFAPRSAAEAWACGVRVVHQDPAICPHLTVAENVALGGEPGWIDRKARDARARRGLERVGAEGIPLGTLARDLAPADAQLVAIARAVADDARVLVLDEPTSSLGEFDVEHVISAVRRAKDAGAAVVYVSHFLAEVMQVADAWQVLRDGKNAGAGTIQGTEPGAIVEAMLGRPAGPVSGPTTLRSQGPIALAGRDLVVGGRTFRIELHQGEILGLFGLLGSGRTELLRALFGLDRAPGGVVEAGGVSGPPSPARAWAAGVGMVSEDRKGEGLALQMSVAENLVLPSLDRMGRLGWVSPARVRARAVEWTAKLGVKMRDVDQPIGELSGGNQQKVAIGRLLQHGARVLLLDEPTRGVDVGARDAIHHLLREAAREGRAVLVVSSQADELLAVCDRIAVLQGGKLGEARLATEWTEHGLVLAAQGLA